MRQPNAAAPVVADAEAMRVRQALVAVGGRGTRFHRAGVAIPLSKSFLRLADKPILYWALQSLWAAGIDRLILTAETERKLAAAYETLDELPVTFTHVDFLLNDSPGSTGLPAHALPLLDDRYIFDCGHSITTPEHYIRLAYAVTNHDGVAFSTFANVSRQRRRLGFRGAHLPVCEPAALDRRYAGLLPRWGYSLDNALPYLRDAGLLQLVRSPDPIEADIPIELRQALPRYRHLARRLQRLIPHSNQQGHKPANGQASTRLCIRTA